MTDVRDHIEGLNREMDACLVRGDLLGYAAFYSDDATSSSSTSERSKVARPSISSVWR